MKEWTEKWNPFNSEKLMAHVYRWKEIIRGNCIPQPVTITVDPVNVCDLNCIWCNADYILKNNNKKIDSDTLKEISHFLANWKGNSTIHKGVETVCIAGGGEPLLHPGVGDFINNCYELGIQIGIVTNGTNIDRYLESLVNCTWVGISIDAGTRETFKKLKGKDMFNKVIDNMRALIEHSSLIKNTPLGQKGRGYGVSYKYLLHPGNIKDIYKAAKIAKECGCKNMHIRPFGEPWDKIGRIKDIFSYSDIVEFRRQLVKARKLEDKNFKVFGITHKFDGNFRESNDFKQCYAIFMTGVFMPPTGKGKFDYGLCCDRRGDKNLTKHNLVSPEQVADFWGSEEHWNIFDKIRVNECPRCTYQPHNIIYENVIKVNNTTYQFI